MKNLIKTACADVGIELDDKQLSKLERYYELLIEWNKKMNLTRITEPEEVAVKHFADSLTLLNFVEIPEGASVIDVGTGAGFPGIPLKIARPDIRLTLLDSLNKRLTFLDEVCFELGIESNLVHSRAEHASKNPPYREAYDLAVSRAVARMRVLAEYCLPYVKVGGQFAAMKGPDLREELEEAAEIIETLGGDITGFDEFSLNNAGDRTIVTIEKTSKTPRGFPRRKI